MPKKIFIVGSDYKWEEQQLEKEAHSLGFSVQFILLSKISFHLSSQTKIFFEGNDILQKIDKNTFFIIRRSRGAYEKLVALVNYLDQNNIHHTDSFRSVTTNLNKKLSLTTINSQLLPHPPGTTFADGDNFENITHKLIPLPCIVKPVMGRHGEGVQIVNDFEFLKTILARATETQIIQSFIDIAAEYRVFVLKEKSLGVIKKIPPEGSKIANYAAGAEFVPAELPQKIIQESIHICQTHGIDIGGVDIAQSKKGDFFLLEVNRCPEFQAFSNSTNLNVAREILQNL